MHFVVGSGPAGISCARALVKAGLPVTLLDAGLKLEDDRQAAVQKLAESAPEGWDPVVVRSLKAGLSASAKGVQVKKIFGSDFPYRGSDELPSHASNVGHFTASLAQGGFSNVWGASMLPFSEKDIERWPLHPKDFAEHYKSILSFVDLSGRKDMLNSLFPLYTESAQTLRLSAQAALLLKRLEESKSKFEEAGFIYGQSRLALRSSPPTGIGCRYCGMCLYGCPYNLIYNTSSTLKELIREPNFTYSPDVIVSRVADHGSGVELQAFDRTTNLPKRFQGSSVFLGAGVLATTRILLQSMDAYSKTLEIPSSEYFIVPLLQFKRAKGAREERLHTSAQLFLECLDKNVSEHSVHMQVYTYSDLYERALAEILGPLKFMLRFGGAEILERMMVIQGYLHSDESSRIKVHLEKGVNGNILHTEGLVNPEASTRIKKVVRKLSKLSLKTGVVVAEPMLQIGRPGEGRHVGGSFPMRLNPKEFECDLHGRPYGFQNVYVVDASNFPSVPASTISFTAMANANRIAINFAAMLRGEERGKVA